MSDLPRDPFPPLTRPATPRVALHGRPAIRTAEEDDLPEITRLDAEAFPDSAYPIFVLRQLFDLHSGFLLVADAGDALDGYVLAGVSPGDSIGWIMSLGVAGDRRGHGLGRRLMVEILKRLRANAVHEVRVAVDPTNTVALTLYESLGFVPLDVGLHTDYFGEGEHRLIMTMSP
ncbi:GNAT family N-acetyltransferase [Streptomyces sp. NPDC001492]